MRSARDLLRVEKDEFENIDALFGLYTEESFALGGAPGDHRVMKLLQQATHLKRVDLAGGAFTSSDLSVLSSFSALEDLRLTDCRNVDDSVFHSLRHPSLRSLDLSGTAVSGSGLLTFRMCSQLTSLNLSGCTRCDDTSLRSLESLPTLQTLLLRDCRRLNGDFLRFLAGTTRLEKLDLTRCIGLDSKLLAFIKVCPSIESLVLEGVSCVRDDAAYALWTLPQLATLSVASTPLTDAGLVLLARCTALTRLDISGCMAITDAAGSSIATLCVSSRCPHRSLCDDC
jgi:hypothetical protein